MSFSMLSKDKQKDNRRIGIMGVCESLGTTLCTGSTASCPLQRIKDRIESDPDITTLRVWEILREEKDYQHVRITDFPDVPPFAVMVECLEQWNSHDSGSRPIRKGMMLIRHLSVASLEQ